ncbi:MAG: rRNA maturation RNase YbeY [Nitrospiraceae bacterium]|nr:MAG: rRNA maturation RNase YbeY [Nitrospiraceae bacterium]
MKILIKDRQRRRPLNKNRVIRVSRGTLSFLNQHKAELSILFVGDREMTRLNSEYRGVHKSTDVLSFPQISGFTPGSSLLTPHFVLGDIVISVPKAESQAKASGRGFYDEVRRLLIHGILHLLGYDHEKSAYSATVMKKKEQEIFHATQEMD